MILRVSRQVRPPCGEKFFLKTARFADGIEDFSAMLEKMKEMILKGDAAGLELFLERTDDSRRSAMSSDVFRVRRAPRLETEITVPGDKSISHRAIMLAASPTACARSKTFSRERLSEHDQGSPAAGCDHRASDPDSLWFTARTEAHRAGGRYRLRELRHDDAPACRHPGGAAVYRSHDRGRLAFQTTDAADHRTAPRQMGAAITALGVNDSPPLVVRGAPPHGITYTTPIASAQVKSAILLAGLHATGVTTVIEPAPSRDHTERMLEYFLVNLRREEGRPERGRKSHECRVSMLGQQQIESRDFAVPGDISSAAFWLVAAACQPGSRLLVKNVGLNPTRTGILDVLVRMGARVREVSRRLRRRAMRCDRNQGSSPYRDGD